MNHAHTWILAALLATVGCSPATGPANAVPAAAPSPAPGWTALRADGFTVTMPGVPKEKEDAVDTPLGKVRTHTFEVEDGSAYFLSLWSDIPLRANGRVDEEAALEGARDNAVLNAGGTLLQDRAMTVGGHLARDFSFSAQGEGPDALGHARVVIAGKRQLVFLAVTAKTDPREADVQRFLDSIAVN